MFELAFIEQCADPGLDIAIVEKFIATVGTENPLAISITDGNRIILPEPPKTPDEAVRLARHFVGNATVRAGVTRFPVGTGISDASEITTELFDACGNISMGTALFGKVYRIVAHAAGGENGTVFSDAVEAWRTGLFAGSYVFAEVDPGPLPYESEAGGQVDPQDAPPISPASTDSLENAATPEAPDPNMAGIRIQLPNVLGRE